MRYKCTVSYDGTNFHGFQVQGSLRTVQNELEKVLLIVCKRKIKLYGAGRTDTGVHAFAQVFHFDTDIVMSPKNMKNAINCRLPKDIYISEVEQVDANFHARFSALSKIYCYLIDFGPYNPLNYNYRWYYKYKFDYELFKESAKIFVGTHDFRSFTKNNELENTTRTIFSIDFEEDGTLIKITFHGDGFMHNMVRIIVAMMMEVARGKITLQDLQEIALSLDRKKAPKIAPPNGLYLVKVLY